MTQPEPVIVLPRNCCIGRGGKCFPLGPVDSGACPSEATASLQPHCGTKATRAKQREKRVGREKVTVRGSLVLFALHSLGQTDFSFKQGQEATPARPSEPAISLQWRDTVPTVQTQGPGKYPSESIRGCAGVSQLASHRLQTTLSYLAKCPP